MTYDRWDVEAAEFQGYVRAKLEEIDKRMGNHEKRLRSLERFVWPIGAFLVFAMPILAAIITAYAMRIIGG